MSTVLLLITYERNLKNEKITSEVTDRDSHDALLEFGNNNLQVLVDITREGVWKNPVLLKILSQQPVETEEGYRRADRLEKSVIFVAC
ncbi:zinc finger protein rlf [Limosa lapponica baueri]|uniref:Zinc finger protein rlf n=1 Tax=Limosa lapponica baueri TaxID=1758121 RepID=A0A2I0TI58_LIMLA|nr:zinc finger protein rlf [Limosa lapponica baueri]